MYSMEGFIYTLSCSFFCFLFLQSQNLLHLHFILVLNFTYTCSLYIDKKCGPHITLIRYKLIVLQNKFWFCMFFCNIAKTFLMRFKSRYALSKRRLLNIFSIIFVLYFLQKQSTIKIINTYIFIDVTSIVDIFI